MHPEQPESDLHWTAFLYVTGELGPDEASSFELLLADDQLARDAVAGAVELAGALAVVGPEFRPRRRPIGRRAFVAAATLAAAACLVLVIAPRLRPDRPDASAVALAWSSLRGEIDFEGPASPAPESAGEIEAGDGMDGEADGDPSTGRALPSWLLSAASAPLGDAPREED
jgi:hypothetical protein